MGHNGGNLALVLSASLDAMPACAWQCVRAMYSTPSWSVERHELRRRSTAVRSLCADSDFAASFAICTAATCALNSPEAGLATALIPLITDSCESAHLLTGDSLASYSASLAFLPECGAECMAAGFADHLASLAPVLNTTSSTSITNATNATTSHDQFYTTLMQDICLDDSFSIWFKYCVNSVCSENDVDYISMLQLIEITPDMCTELGNATTLPIRLPVNLTSSSATPALLNALSSYTPGKIVLKRTDVNALPQATLVRKRRQPQGNNSSSAGSMFFQVWNAMFFVVGYVFAGLALF